MEKGKNVVKRGRPFKTNPNDGNGSKRTRVGDATDDSWDDFIPIAAARQHRKEMEVEEAEIEEDDDLDLANIFFVLSDSEFMRNPL